jgi:hypothetical protein
MAEVFRTGESVYVTADANKRKYTIGEVAPLLVQIIPVEPIMQEVMLYADAVGTPYLNDKGQVSPKRVMVEDRARKFINPAKLSRFSAPVEAKKE